MALGNLGNGQFGQLNSRFQPPEDSFTKLLLHFDDTTGQQVVQDYSGNYRGITSSSAYITATYSQFYPSCYAGNKSGTQYWDVASNSDFQFGTASFTVEFWAMIPSGATSTLVQSVITKAVDDSHRLNFLLYQGNMYLQSFDSGDASVRIDISCPVPTWVVGTWKHFAWVRNNTGPIPTAASWFFFVDGSPKTKSLGAGSYANPTYFGSANLRIGTDGRTGYSPGTPGFMIDEVRISKGVARWTATFSPPTAPY